MSRLPSLTLATAALILPTLAVPTPALAQRVNEIIVYGTDPCPRSTDDEVVVCARKPESERFRIPENLRQGGSLQSRQAWANRAIAFETYGKTGINSCSPVGPAGFTGCSQQLVSQAFKERREETTGTTPPEE
ncbi:MAG TPA: hypothetical protein VM531_09300 [Sphingomicrobium sp.]|jgi:hypothetical protein|nr:hypothetical protein [Sphingomicrobium sp.]